MFRNYLKELLEVVKRAEKVVKSGGTVVISCLSGRGRTGTLASILIGNEHFRWCFIDAVCIFFCIF